jgi:hypothetical protein
VKVHDIGLNSSTRENLEFRLKGSDELAEEWIVNQFEWLFVSDVVRPIKVIHSTK